MIRNKDNFIIIETKSTSLIFEIKDFDDKSTSFNKNKKFITQFYYGYTSTCPSLIESNNNLPGSGSANDYIIDKLISSTYGNGNNSEPLLLIDNNDNTYINRFFYKSFKIIEGSKEINGPHARDVLETLEIIEIDEVLNIELHHYYSIFKDSDIIVSKKEIINLGKKSCNILRLFSLELPLESKSFDVETFDGAWLFERSRHTSTINNGLFVIDSKIGASSNRHNPYIQIIDKSVSNKVYGFNLIYSGDHKEEIDVNHLKYSTVLVGINDLAFSYELNTNNSFITPEALFTLKPNKDELTSEMHSFVRNHILPPNFANKSRPVLFNNWEGTGMKIDEKSLLDMAKIAKKVGIELFVMDDGWFKNRVTDDGGLGDWSTDLNKFPNGLKSFVDQIKGLGLKFGIWIEPEMICINSDLYKSHPEFACIIKSREPIERRHQLMIDMSNPKVVDYLYISLCKIFDEIKPDYIKWDYNRFHTDMYSPYGTKRGELLYKCMYGSYDLFDRLTKRYPNTLFEGCASGGARFDLGMLYYTPQIWGSDDTNTFLRTFITCGTVTAYPQSCIGAHVSRDYCICKERNARSSLEDRFNLNSIGAFGYEFDFRTFEEKELNIMARQIEFYKLHRNLLQLGNLYINKNCFDDNKHFSFTIVNDDGVEAILFIEELEKGVTPIYWNVKGINPNYIYIVEEREQYNTKESFKKEYSGKELIEKGLYVGTLANTDDAHLYPLGVFTRIFYLKKK